MDIGEIEREIRKIEADKTSWGNAERLAVLYTVREHLEPQREVRTRQNTPIPQYSYAPSPPVSDFVSAASLAPTEAMLEVLDEHMEAIKTLYPKEYDAVVRKLKDLAK